MVGAYQLAAVWQWVNWDYFDLVSDGLLTASLAP
jgi:hypothetical protein